MVTEQTSARNTDPARSHPLYFAQVRAREEGILQEKFESRYYTQLRLYGTHYKGHFLETS